MTEGGGGGERRRRWCSSDKMEARVSWRGRCRGSRRKETAGRSRLFPSEQAPREAIHHCTCRWGWRGGLGGGPRGSRCGRLQSEQEAGSSCVREWARIPRSSYLEVVVRVPGFVLPGVAGRRGPLEESGGRCRKPSDNCYDQVLAPGIVLVGFFGAR